MPITNVGWPELHEQALLPLIESGLPASKIADAINLMFRTKYSRNAIVGKASRLGMPCKGKHFPAAKRDDGVAPKKPRARAVTADKPWRLPPVKPPRAVTVLACARIVPKGIACVDLEPGHCRWPYGEADITFCGHERLPGQPYCQPHLHLSRGDGTRSEREAVRV